MEPPRLCLVIPCYNEERRLPVSQLRAWIANEPSTRLLFVNDGSKDGTARVLADVCAGNDSTASVLSLPVNGGKAEAVRQGMLHALSRYQPEIIGFWDADLATPLEVVPRLLGVLQSRPEIEMIFGARVKLLGRRIERQPLRHYLGRVFATVVSNAMRLEIYDTQCGAKLFRVTPQFRQVFAEPFLSRWIFDVEILARYLKVYHRHPAELEALIYEYPLETWVDVAGSKVRPLDFFVALWDIFRIRQAYRRN